MTKQFWTINRYGEISDWNLVKESPRLVWGKMPGEPKSWKPTRFNKTGVFSTHREALIASIAIEEAALERNIAGVIASSKRLETKRRLLEEKNNG